jgi:energy-coupling factor transporter ATP-binding protein EcfA2
MKTSKIIIKNLFGIKELTLDGKSIELTGVKGAGKSSVIDAIRYALTNKSDRDYIIKDGENEGEILIETDTGLSINRKKRNSQADYKSIKENGKDVPKPESFLQEIFTPLSLNPVEFTQKSKEEQNRIILDLIDFQWDVNWIKEKFGEIPQGVNYDQNILKVLADIQAENGVYFQTRQDLNRDARNKQAFIYDIAKTIPENYDYNKWNTLNTGELYRKLETIKNQNNEIQRAIVFKESYNNKIRGYEAEKEIAISSEEKAIASERENLTKSIERMKAEIIAAEDKLKGLANKLEDKKKIAMSEYETKVAKLDGDIQIANKYADKPQTDTTELNEEINTAETMKKHLNEYQRMITMQSELDKLKADSEALTEKIELARTLPGEILKTATIPVEGLTVKDGIPLINGLPVSNLSDGEKLDLCVDITISKPSAWSIILLDGTEKLDEVSRANLYKKCKDKGLQFIATRTTNDNELEITQL